MMASSALRPLCTKLLELPTAGIEAQGQAIEAAEALEKVLEALPASALQSCYQCALFPLLLLIDAAVVLRAKGVAVRSKPVIVSDRLAERVAACLEILLRKCPVQDIQEMATLLRKLVGAAMLTPDEASEEFRHGVVKCLASMFQHLPPQGDVAERMRSEEMAAAIGHLFSVLLQISHAEAARAGVGSGSIRADSLATLRIVVTKVASPDALAFFLPGVASGLGKVIKGAVVSNGRSGFVSAAQFYSVGAAASSRSLSEAILGIAELLVLVLADSRSLVTADIATPRIQDQEALGALQKLSKKAVHETRRDEHQLEVADTSMEDRKVMRVECHERWLADTVSHIDKLLQDVLPLLCAHPVAAVRKAVVEATGQIIGSCQKTLEVCMPLLLETLLLFACGDSSSVSATASHRLSFLAHSGSDSKLRSAFTAVLNRLLEDLPKVVISADEVSALHHARRLAAAMYYSGPRAVFTSLFQSPACVSRFITIMTQSLSLPSTFASSGYIESGGYKFREISLPHGASLEAEVANDQLPRTAPWFTQAGKVKLYDALASTLRLAGFSSLRGSVDKPSLADLLLLLQSSIRDCASESGADKGGQLRRSAAAAACALNEIIYGASGTWLDRNNLFGSKESNEWDPLPKADFLSHVRDAIDDVLHDYMVSELWDLPVDSQGSDESDLAILEDNATLQQVLIEGVGIFGMTLGSSFETSGYLGLVIYPLLEKLGCSRYSVAHAASISLRAISHHSGYVSVQKLVVANLDHVVDSLCRQLRHISMYPHAPEFLTAILQQTGAAADLLPLLEEPMRGLLQELEIPGRHHHPYLTVPILKALREITRAARHESFELASSDLPSSMDEGEQNIQTLLQHKRCHHSVLTVASSCIVSSAPLLASKNIPARILALDIIEDGVAALSKIEAAYKASNLRWEEAMQAFERSQGNLDYETPDRDPNDGNKLLPTIHQIWPHVVCCLRSEHPAVLVRCLSAIAFVARECGGSFLARRLQKDVLPLLLRLLQDGPVTGGRVGLDQLIAQPATRALATRESPGTVRKVQEAALKCIKAISGDKKSAPALDAIFETVAGAVVSLACSQWELKELAAETASALSSSDPDLVWILAADLAYESGEAVAPASPCLPSCSEILPPLTSDTEALCSQYAGRDFRLQHKLDRRCAYELLCKLESSTSFAKKQ
ncbi:TELO2-interacting protein 1 homolog isoform X1 [Selaginella moellendorffii]|uniref:TELO2-interacting protein 1 homolog isoform X1 n=2 Tax=Selaginella moellendorffii TaxID=88036 RepID=UPI000D1C50BA|nr:TELO2-interacting protein 1 homolog isoform X1 [Selaginella moellendorffii]|eukprot:XP_024523552.1 TELO2-interacting protein 1 homolog isoform X1 [Selaginella moellendorffii]